jgi:hypothetical protein
VAHFDSPMGSEGVPFLFDSFAVSGSAEMEKVLTQGWTVPAAVTPDKRRRDMPIENLVVTFD